MTRMSFASALVAAGAALSSGATAQAAIIDLTIDGGDAVFLAGRTDVVIPLASAPWGGPGTYLSRHGSPTPEEVQETLPPFISVSGGDVIRAADPAVGGINFFNGDGPPYYGPGGSGEYDRRPMQHARPGDFRRRR